MVGFRSISPARQPQAFYTHTHTSTERDVPQTHFIALKSQMLLHHSHTHTYSCVLAQKQNNWGKYVSQVEMHHAGTLEACVNHTCRNEKSVCVTAQILE